MGYGEAIFWNPTSFGANQEAYVTFTTVDSDAMDMDLVLKSQSNTNWEAGLEVWYDPAVQRVEVWTYTSGQGWVQRGTSISVTFADGDQLGARATADGQVRVYKNGSLLGTRDVTGWPYYASSGYIGLWLVGAAAAMLDDFGGGTYTQAMYNGMSVASVPWMQPIVDVPNSGQANKAKALYNTSTGSTTTTTNNDNDPLYSPRSYQTSETTATFVYDGDGNRVMGTVGETTTIYLGNYFEWTSSTSTMKKYYYAGTTRVAVRTGTDIDSISLKWLFGDHLGSQSVTADASGNKTGEVRFKAWGEDRYVWGTTPTSYRFTGQRIETSLSIYYYGARWYDSYLNRWTSPDSIIPDPYNALDYDRYAYSRNNPVRYNDPSGHMVCDGEGHCGGRPGPTAILTIDDILDSLSGKKIPFGQLTPRQQNTIKSAGWSLGEYNEFANGGNAIDVGGTLQDPAVWIVGLISAGKLTPSVISLLQGLFKPIETAGPYVVYRLVENGVTRYIGITNDIFSRTEQHFVYRGWLIEPIPGLENLSEFDARALEQALIEYFGLQNLYNQINSISPNNPIYQQAIQRGMEILRSIGFFGP